MRVHASLGNSVACDFLSANDVAVLHGQRASSFGSVMADVKL